ncbi:MAG: coproporphyrinogen III oxidase [Alphaproteobacteria bacterium]|nr:coproporphyrinogen III oxidase [Alphaproteobacteria bacterium]
MIETGQMGLYFHWPFCLSKCPYCDFNTHIRENVDRQRWLDAYKCAMDFYAEKLPHRIISSIFFGGGTPSLMPPQTIGEIIAHAQKLWPQVNDLEVTLEANPTSVEAEKFAAFADAGVNRVSIGVQALNDNDLKFLGRQHDVKAARRAIDIACKNFPRYSFDLIYARPGQTLESWKNELDEAFDLSGGHLSLYQLTIERNTPFYFAHAQKRFAMPEEDLAADFYHLTQEATSKAGLPAYEVSNHAAEDHQSRHNMNYWRYGDYIGIGPGAHGRLTLEDGVKYATREHQSPDIWLEWVGEKGSGAHPFTPLSRAERFNECLMMGLRMSEGLNFVRLEEQGACRWQERINEERLKTLQAEGWLSYDDERIILNAEGLLRLNAILPYILLEAGEGGAKSAA